MLQYFLSVEKKCHPRLVPLSDHKLIIIISDRAMQFQINLNNYCMETYYTVHMFSVLIFFCTGRVAIVTNVFIQKVERFCDCGFNTTEVMLHCSSNLDKAATYRARLADSSFLPAIQNWIHDDGTLQIQNVLIEVDKSCPVVIVTYTDSECTNLYDKNSSTTVIVGGAVGGVVVCATVSIFIAVIILILPCRKKKR